MFTVTSFDKNMGRKVLVLEKVNQNRRRFKNLQKAEDIQVVDPRGVTEGTAHIKGADNVF
jgi:hypothetical protein